jgi:hypothetical protein
MRKVRHAEQELFDARFDLLEPSFQLADAGADRLQLVATPLESRAIGLGELRHVLVGGVALGLFLLDLDDERTPS